jgi:chemotaxis protein methyltransferase CheR
MPQSLLAQDIVAASREPLLVLDGRMTVLADSRSVGAAFGIDEEAVVGSPLAQISNGQWDLPLLVEQLERVASGETTLKDFEVSQDTASGARTFLLHASALGRDGGQGRPVLLTMEDVSERRRIEADCEETIARANNMLVELNHRVMNSFAMIGAILAMEARLQQDDHCRSAFARMQTRISSIAHLYRNLGRNHTPETVSSDEYLPKIVNDLMTSFGDPTRKVDVAFSIAKAVLPTRIAVPVGLVVNEIVTNSLKHAFVDRAHGTVRIEFAEIDDHHVLRIIDNGRGIDENSRSASGLGQRLSDAFARQLRGTIEQTSGPGGTTVVLKFPRVDGA